MTHSLIGRMTVAVALVAMPIAASAATPEEQAAAKEGKVCKKLERSGSKMKMVVCLTPAEWKKMQDSKDQ